MTLELERDALSAIAAANDGLLFVDAVVEKARDTASPLHRHFTWDDGKAADEHRRAEARALIARVEITVLRPEPTVIRAFVSLPSNRKAGGYSSTVEVLGVESQRAEMLDELLRRVAYWRSQAVLFASAPVMSALASLETAATAERDTKSRGSKSQRATA